MSRNPVEIWRTHKSLKNYLNKKGKLIVWTKIFTAPLGFENQVPYIVGIIEFEDKTRLPLQIVDCEEADLKPNLKVTTVIRRIGKTKPEDVIEYGVKVRPL